MLYESDDESNKIDLLYESATTERNGVKVIVPVKWGDRETFFKKIKEQLAYFENVFFDCTNGWETINNETIKIVRSEHFQWSSLSKDSLMHICLDNVYYPIDFAKLGIYNIAAPVGLRFSLKDGIFPVPNRETIKYTKETKDIILAKIREVAEYFVTKYNEGIKDCDDIFKIFETYRHSQVYVPHLSGNGNMEIHSSLLSYSRIPLLKPKLNKVKLLDMKKIFDIRDYLLQEYEVKYLYQHRKFNGERKSWRWKKTLAYDSVYTDNVYVFTELLPTKKLYFRELLDWQTRYFVRKERTFKLGDVKRKFTGRGFDNYVAMLQLHDHPKSEWRTRIKECQYIISLLTAKFIDADKIEIPQEWFDNRKKQRVETMIANGTNIRRKKLIGEVSGKVASSLERYVANKNCKFVPITYQMKDAHKGKRLIIYGNSANEPLFQKLYSVFDVKGFSFVIFSEREMKNLEKIELHNWIEVGKFMEGKHKAFRRVVTGYLIHKLIEEYSGVFNRASELKQISTPLGEKLEKLFLYHDEYFTRDGDKELYKLMIGVAEDKKLFDYSIFDVYQEVKYILERLPFLEPMCERMSYRDNSLIPYIIDLCKYYKQRINWQNYTLPINEKVEGPVEEVVEEIIDGD